MLGSCSSVNQSQDAEIVLPKYKSIEVWEDSKYYNGLIEEIQSEKYDRDEFNEDKLYGYVFYPNIGVDPVEEYAEELIQNIEYSSGFAEGNVVVKVKLGIDGCYISFMILESSNPQLDSIVIDAIKKSKIEPFTQIRNSKSIVITIPLSFRQKDKNE